MEKPGVRVLSWEGEIKEDVGTVTKDTSSSAKQQNTNDPILASISTVSTQAFTQISSVPVGPGRGVHRSGLWIFNGKVRQKSYTSFGR